LIFNFAVLPWLGGSVDCGAEIRSDRMQGLGFWNVVGIGVVGIALAAGERLAVAEPLRVMSFNVRYGTAADGENAWPKRKDLVIETIRSAAPHVIGTQEGLRFQLDELRAALPQYQEVGVGRDDGKEAGEYAAILYDARRIEVLDEGTFWFCDTPEVAGTPTWGAKLPRVCTWLRGRDKEAGGEGSSGEGKGGTGKGREFYVFNNHWDHQSQESREKSAAMLLERIAGREAASLPVIVTGDFNANEENASFRRLVDEDSQLRDSFRAVHPEATDVGTFHNFTGECNIGKIDAVLVSPEWQVEAAEINRTHDGKRYPSDHFPVTAMLELGTSSE
jgi:endonuclease/exonuclease/phosphatase family metal-dependent hydrolase